MDSFEQRLRSIDWSRYHHAYGPADDVPELLLAIANADADIEAFSSATSALWGNVFHQGTRWGVTSKTVPFFIELLTTGPRAVRAKRFLVTYLHHLALGYPQSVFPGHFPLGEVMAIATELEAVGVPAQALEGDVFGDDLPAAVRAVQDRIGAVWERDCFLAVERGVPSMLLLLDAEDDGLVGDALALVSSFPGQRAVSSPGLWALARDSGAVGRRGMALVALARLGVEVVEPARVLMDADDGLDGLYAACAEIIGAADPSEIARRRLVQLPEGLGETECAFSGSVTNLVAWCVEKAPPSDGALAFKQLESLLISAKGFTKLGVLDRLLKLAFPDKPGASLSVLQRQAIEASVEHGIWHEGMIFGNQNDVFRAHGLPTTRDELRALLVK
ncbi:MAG: hypothetical protein JNM69_39875 [Archangium sp.]|nr:hypothetical protein [Archangium sp.]